MKTLILLIPFLIGNYLCLGQDKWVLKTDKDSIKVYTRDRDNSNLKEFKAVTSVSGGITRCLKLMDDISKFTEWQSNVDTVVLLNKVSESKRILYFKSNLPWPMDNRDSIFENRKVWNSDSSKITYANIILPDYLPKQDGYVRISEADGFWSFDIGDNSIDVTYQWSGDPGGKIPSWLVNLFIVDGPFRTLKNFRELYYD